MLLWNFVACALVLLPGCRDDNSGNIQPPVVSVTVAKPIQKQIVEWDAYSGRMDSVEFVEVRPRVGGYLQSIHFDDGQIVNSGDLLFVIEPRPFEAELSGAKATLAQSKSQLQQAIALLSVAQAQLQQREAQFKLAEARLKRTQTLLSTNAVSREEMDQRDAEFLGAKADQESSLAQIASAEAAIAAARAAIESAQAKLDMAQLNLDYTRIYAPITGRISNTFVDQGNLVNGGTATSTLMTTITSMQPIYCVFDANEQQVLKYIRLAQRGQRQSSRVAKNPAFLGLVDETGFPHQGYIDFVDNRFDANTASMRARCVFPNTDQVLLPGMFARIRIPGSAPYEAVLIPDSAIGTDQSSQFVYVVENNVIQRRAVTPGPIVDGLRVIREGLVGDETLVIEGLLQSRPGVEVKTTPGSIDVVDDGLPDDYQTVPAVEAVKDENASPDANTSPDANPLSKPIELPANSEDIE